MSLESTYNQITNNIFIGNQWSAKIAIVNDMYQNNSNKITHIISLISLPMNLVTLMNNNNVEYYEHCFDDSIDVNIITHYNKIKEHIDKILDDNSNTLLVLCQAGKSRSVSIVLLTLINKYNMSFENAINLIKSKREIHINKRFYGDILDYYNNKLLKH